MLLTQPHSYGDLLGTREVSGFLLSETNYSRNSSVPYHSHDQPICCVALNGACTEVYKRSVREIRPFTLDFLPAHETHSLDFSFADVRAFAMHIGPQWLERMRQYSLFLDRAVQCHGGIATKLLMNMYGEFHLTDTASPLAIEGLAVELLAEISRGRKEARDNQVPHWLERTREMLHAHFCERLRLVEIAKTIGVHPVHLCREFRKHYRCTVGEYIRQLRLENACRSLSTSDTPLSEIASVNGFADQSHFSRTFKRLTGMSPAIYRRLTSSR